MHEPDLDLRDTSAPEAPPPRRPRSWAPAAAAAVIVAILASAGYWYFGRGTAPALPAPAEVGGNQSGAAPEPLGAIADPVDVPPLDMSDAVVRELVSGLSTHPRIAAWLATDGLIRNFTVVVENIANNQSPAGHLQVLRPAGPFRQQERGEQLIIDPASYERYTGIADAVASVDPAGAARLYTILKPRIEEAYRELGHQEPFDRALERAIVSLLRVPDAEGNVELAPQGAVYQFANPRFEQLTPPQKQLLRMGPRNVRTIQQRLREIALTLGIPPDRLP